MDIPGGPDLDTPLHDAIQNAQFPCCQLLLEHGADPLLPNGAGLTPLQLVELGLSKLNDSKSRVKFTPKNSKMNSQGAIHDALVNIQKILVSSVAKRCPPILDNTVKLNESTLTTQDITPKHSLINEAVNLSLSTSFKERYIS